MKILSRIALAIPVCIAMALPASANQWFDFSVSFGSSYTLTGRTLAGQDQEGTPYRIGDSVGYWQLNGQAITMYTGNLVSTGGDVFARDGDNQRVSFSGGNLSFLAPTGSSAESIYFTTNGLPEYFFINASATEFRVGSAVNGDGIPDNQSGTFSTTFAVSESNVILTPEINGSGFAYIAFILGALGLWLYSGGLGRREDQTPVAA